ncbi:MAG: DUF2294 domain-containing protein [Actinobacteria bacterium]|nr:DUF2294 domain-containing protein [Actinomycetota bacterium]
MSQAIERRGSVGNVAAAAINSAAARTERSCTRITFAAITTSAQATLGLAVLSIAVTELVRSHGRSPSVATSWRSDERCVVTALFDFLTPAEHALGQAGDAALARQLRSAFAEAVADEYLRAAEGAIGEEVIAHSSELVCESGICLESFLLANHRRIPREFPRDPVSPAELDPR